MKLWDLVFPKRCVSCGRIEDYLCTKCFSFLSFDLKSICVICKKGSLGGTHERCIERNSIDSVICALSSSKTSRKLLSRFKNEPYQSQLKGFIGELFYEALIQSEELHSYLRSTLWTMYFVRSEEEILRRRGYNQSELLAKELSKRLGINIAKSKNILLVDDILDSEESIRREARILKDEGAERVVGLVFIRGQ